ncbi:MAG: Nif3-like dinuclear metal center hexameric protein [Firmicutes bacterium]|nr:Nif3-like dinuclear metal center hexameric protein [Bacillota bacterium]
MTSVRDVYDFLDRFAPFASQMEFDNSGLQCGDFGACVQQCLVCLDVTPQVIEQAARAHCELIVAHHPVLFRARKQLLSSDPAWLLARHGIACIASHTPLDCCAGGVNDLLAEALGLDAPTLLTPLIRLCTLPAPMPAKAFAELVSRKLGAPVRYRDAGAPIRNIAICAGEGCHFLEEAYACADAFLTGDAGHHDFLDAAQHGLALLAAGHYETEIAIVPALARRLRAAFPSVEWHIADEYGGIQYA